MKYYISEQRADNLVCVNRKQSSSLTFGVELEGAQRGVDAHRHWTHFKQRDSQRVLVAFWDLLVAFALGCHA